MKLEITGNEKCLICGYRVDSHFLDVDIEGEYHFPTVDTESKEEGKKVFFW